MASLIKRNSVWYVQYKKDGRWRRVSCKTSTKKIAQEVLNRYKVAETEEDHEFLQRNNKNNTTLGDFLEKHLADAEGKISPKWYKDKSFFFNSYLVPFFGEDTHLKDITLQRIEKYRSKRLKTVSPRTVNIEVSCLLKLLRQAIEWGEMSIQYFPKVKPLKENKSRVRYLEKEEINALLESAGQYGTDMETYLRLMLYAGLRSGEALNLRWVDVDLDKNMLHITPRKDWKPKSGKSRAIPIMDKFTLYLKDLRNKYPESIYVTQCSKEFTSYRMTRLFMKVVQNAELESHGEDKVTAHTLRHTYASHLVMNGTPLYTVSQLLGHSDTKTTQIYAHLAPDYLQNAVKGLDF